MAETSLVSEVERVMEKSCTKDIVSALRTGYKEILDYLPGNTSPLTGHGYTI